jgi:hypothetical protein
MALGTGTPSFESDPEAQDLLRHGTVHTPLGVCLGTTSIFGDYFFLEALLAAEGRAPDLSG